MYVYADQQSAQWLIKATDKHELGSGTRLKATNTGKTITKMQDIRFSRR